jgi:hypothetical protein
MANHGRTGEREGFLGKKERKKKKKKRRPGIETLLDAGTLPGTKERRKQRATDQGRASRTHGISRPEAHPDRSMIEWIRLLAVESQSEPEEVQHAGPEEKREEQKRTRMGVSTE